MSTASLGVVLNAEHIIDKHVEDDTFVTPRAPKPMSIEDIKKMEKSDRVYEMEDEDGEIVETIATNYTDCV